MDNIDKDHLLIAGLDIVVFLIVYLIASFFLKGGMAFLISAFITMPISWVFLYTIPGTFDKREKRVKDE